jgi:PAS domain-containing protein
MAHLFEQRHEENREFASGDRLVYHDIEKIHRDFVRNTPLIAALEAMRQPLMVFDNHRQLIYANQTALEKSEAKSISEVLALRLGEFFGTEHRMQGHQCGQIGGCADCNRLPSLMEALKGQESTHQGEVILFPEDPAKSATFSIRSAPLPSDGKTFALVILEPVAAI